MMDFLNVLKNVNVDMEKIPLFRGEFKEVVNQKGCTYIITTYGIYMLKQEHARAYANGPDELVHDVTLVALFDGGSDV